MEALNYDTLVDQPYDSALYDVDGTVTPLEGFAAWGEGAYEQYQALGFVSVANAYTPEEVESSIDAFRLLLGQQMPEGTQLQFENAAIGKVEGMTPDERMDYVRKFMTFYHLDQRLVDLALKPDLIKVVTRLLGSEPEVYQDMALLKPPGIGREKPWHQDHAYFNLPMGTPVVGVWIALDAAYLENGCMCFLPGGHHEGPLPHFNRRDWQICDADVMKKGTKVSAPLPAGGALIFDGLTPHGTPSNKSGARRRALQFHYIPKDTRRISLEERMELFGADGVGATC